MSREMVLLLTWLQMKCNKDDDKSNQFYKYPKAPLQVIVLDRWTHPYHFLWCISKDCYTLSLCTVVVPESPLDKQIAKAKQPEHKCCFLVICKTNKSYKRSIWLYKCQYACMRKCLRTHSRLGCLGCNDNWNRVLLTRGPIGIPFRSAVISHSRKRFTSKKGIIFFSLKKSKQSITKCIYNV